MNKKHFVQTIAMLLAGLTLMSCAAQTADPPLPTVSTSSAIANATTNTPTTTDDVTTPATTAGTDSSAITIDVPPVTQTDPEVTTTVPDVTTNGTAPSTTEPSTTETPDVNTPHTHNYTSKVTKSATCTENGTTVFTCTCGESYTETIPAIGHSYAKTNEQTSTSTVNGKELKTIVITYTCTNCKDSYSDTRTETVGDTHTHSYTSTVTKTATCTSNGTKTYTCSICNASYTETIPAIGHSYTGKVTTNATCTKDGVKTYTCANCKNTYTETIKATGHSWSSWKTTTTATCTMDGIQTRTCSKCNNSETKKISATGHSWGSWKTTKEATCTTDGIQTRSCTKCSNTETKKITATGHSWSNWKVTKEPTTTTEGIETRTCSKCNSTETRKIDKLPAENATPEDCEWMANYFLQLLNEERKKAGVQTLVTDAKMKEMAQVRANEITTYFAHNRPNGIDTFSSIFDDFQYGNYYDMTQLGFPASYNYYAPTYYDEDIAMDFHGGVITTKEFHAQSLLATFKRSTAHWNSLMNGDFGAVGVAISAVESKDYPGYYEFYCEVLLADKLY